MRDKEKSKITLLEMALPHDDDSGAIFDVGFTRGNKTAEAIALIDELVAEGLLETITLYKRTERGEDHLIDNAK